MQMMIDIVWLVMEVGKGLAVGGIAGISLLFWLRRTADRMEREAEEKARVDREKEIENLFLELLQVTV